MPASRSTPAGRLRLAALVIFVVGMVVAAWVYVSAVNAQKRDGASEASYASLADTTRREMQQVERLGGKATVMTVQFNQWLTSLWRGERLAYTLAVLSIVAAFGCRAIADLIDEPHDDDPRA